METWQGQCSLRFSSMSCTLSPLVMDGRIAAEAGDVNQVSRIVSFVKAIESLDNMIFMHFDQPGTKDLEATIVAHGGCSGVCEGDEVIGDDLRDRLLTMMSHSVVRDLCLPRVVACMPIICQRLTNLPFVELCAESDDARDDGNDTEIYAKLLNVEDGAKKFLSQIGTSMYRLTVAFLIDWFAARSYSVYQHAFFPDSDTENCDGILDILWSTHSVRSVVHVFEMIRDMWDVCLPLLSDSVGAKAKVSTRVASRKLIDLALHPLLFAPDDTVWSEWDKLGKERR